MSPVKSGLLHVDFFEVSLAEKVRIDVPIVLTGEAPVTRHREFIMVQDIDSLSVECLPTNMPNEASLDLSVLTEAEHSLKISDIKLGEGITIINDPDQVIARIATLRLAEEDVTAEEKTGAEAAAAAPVAPAEGEAAAG